MENEVVFVVEPDQYGGWQAICQEEGILTHADTLEELTDQLTELLPAPIRLEMGKGYRKAVPVA